MIDLASTLLVVVEFVVALYIVAADVKEVRFLLALKPLIPTDEDLPLYSALTDRAIFLMAVGVYLLALTVVAAFGPQLAVIFPPIRVINGAIFLAILAGPRYLGHAMRRSPRIKKAIEEQ